MGTKDEIATARASAFGSAFAEAMRRGCHGQEHTAQSRVGEHIETVRTTIDARPEAERWALVVADAAEEAYGRSLAKRERSG